MTAENDALVDFLCDEQEHYWEQESYIIEQNEADEYRYELDDYEDSGWEDQGSYDYD